MNNTPQDANMSVDDLKRSVNTPNQNGILQRMSAYVSNITGSDAYWQKRRNELEATFQQKKSATVFFTFSYADNYWPYLHRLMPRNYNVEEDKINKYHNCSDVIKNSHLTDWWFSQRLNSFLSIYFDQLMGCDWGWHRFEYQSRTAIHAYGCARFKNDPGLIELTKKAYVGRLTQKIQLGKSLMT